MGAKKFRTMMVTGARGRALPMTLDFAYSVVNMYRRKNYKIKQLWHIADGWLDHMVNGKGIMEYKDGLLRIDAESNRIIFPNDLYLRYPNLQCVEGDYVYSQARKNKTTWKKIYGGMVVENVTQSGSRHSMAPQLLKIAERYRAAMLVHDEGVYVVPEAEAEEAKAFALECFRELQSWTPGLPLDAEAGYDYCYSK